MTRVAIVLFAILMLMPMYFMATGSLQDIHGVMLMPPRLIPRGITIANYTWIWDLGLAQWVVNTMLIVILGTAASVATSLMAGYTFAFYDFPLKRWIWLALLAGIMIPAISLVIPRFVVMRKLHLSGTLWSVVLAGALQPMGLYLARVYFKSVPPSLLESARIDGASEWQILWRVVAPVSKPIVTALSLFAAIVAMGDFLWQMLQLQRRNVQTLLVGLIRAVQTFGGIGDAGVNPIGRRLAVGMVLLAPLLLVFFVASRYFTTSLSGAVKG